MPEMWYKISDNAMKDKTFPFVLIGKNKHYLIEKFNGDTIFNQHFFKDNDFKEFLELNLIQLI